MKFAEILAQVSDYNLNSPFKFNEWWKELQKKLLFKAITDNEYFISYDEIKFLCITPDYMYTFLNGSSHGFKVSVEVDSRNEFTGIKISW